MYFYFLRLYKKCLTKYSVKNQLDDFTKAPDEAISCIEAIDC